MRVLVLDTETTGLPQKVSFDLFYPPCDLEKYSEARVFQIAWIIAENGTETECHNYFVKPTDGLVKHPNMSIHNNSIERCHSEGVDLAVIINKLKNAIESVDLVVGHNLAFDIHVLQSECVRQKYVFIDLLNTLFTKSFCTMYHSKYQLRIMSGKYIKHPSLGELHNYCFGSDIFGAHDALVDCRATLACYLKIKDHPASTDKAELGLLRNITNRQRKSSRATPIR